MLASAVRCKIARPAIRQALCNALHQPPHFNMCKPQARSIIVLSGVIHLHCTVLLTKKRSRMQTGKFLVQEVNRRGTQDQARRVCLQCGGDLDSGQRKTCQVWQETPLKL